MTTVSAPAARLPYDPCYDPLVAASPGQGCDYAPTYWIATAGRPPADDGPITGDCDADAVIIGSGYTGLSTALHLAREHGIKARVLEANGVAWGCSTRNGGQAQIAAGRLKRSQWIERWGIDVARRMHGELTDAFDLFRDLVASLPVDCEPQEGGHLYIAHRASVMPALARETAVLNEKFSYPARMLSREEVQDEHVRDHEAAGAMLEPDGMSIHPAKLAFGYLAEARRLGARVHPASPVIGFARRDGMHHLTTPGGTVRTPIVCIATGGYTSTQLHPLTRHRLMPILSNSIVTRPLTEAEQEACGFRTLVPLTDTRTLRHYYRQLPDGRVQIGSRSAVTGADAPNGVHLDRLKQGLYRKFPALEGIEIDYSWWGWVDVSHDMMPRICAPEPGQSIYYALGYGGNGVMYSAQAGRRMAALAAGRKDQCPDLPIFGSALPDYGLLTPFRRTGQRLMYHWYHLKDDVI